VKHAFALLLVLMMAPGAGAQDTLSLNHFLSAARKNSPALRMAANALRSAEASRGEIGATLLPRLNGVLGATYAPLPPTFGYDAALSNGGQLGAQIILHQSLYDGGTRTLRDDQAVLDLRRLGLEATLAERDLEFAVRVAYVEVLRGDAVVALQRAALERLEGYAGLVRRMNKSGVVGYTDVLKVEMQVAAAQIAVAGAAQEAATARLALLEAAGEQSGPAFSVAGSLEEMSAAALDDRPAPSDSSGGTPLDLDVADVAVERGVVERELTTHERYPVVELTADAGYLRSLENFKLPAEERIRGFGYSIGIGVEVPILHWGAIGLRVEQKELALDDLRQKREILRRSLASDISRTKSGLSTARAQLAILREGSARAEEGYLLTKSMYAGGGAIAMEVLAAHQAISDTRLAEIQTRAAVLVLSARRERLINHELLPSR
jgi:outer membrane protein TolC